MSLKDHVETVVYEFAKADYAQLFNFTSGHLGALPMSDAKMVRLFQYTGFVHVASLTLLLILEFIKFIVLTIFPIKNLQLILRTLLRRTFSTRVYVVHELSVISLGPQPYEKDAYFSSLLNNLDDKFNYLKIVSGFHFKSNDYLFIESALSYLGLCKLIFSILLSPVLSVVYLVACIHRLDSLNKKAIFIIFGLKDINSGSFNNNKVIVKSIKAWIDNNKVSKLLFPMEGRNWEKNIVESTQSKSIRAIGYLHCALTPKHLSLVHAGFYKKQGIPSMAIAPSQMSANILRKTFPSTEVKQGWFLRGSKNSNKQLGKNNNTLLFALTGNIEESCAVIDWIAESPIKASYRIIIRLNPNTSTYTFLAKYVEKHQLKLYTGAEDFLPQVCFFRSSSVALDYLKLDVLPVYISINEIVSNNTFELDNKYHFKQVPISHALSDSLAELEDYLQGGFNGGSQASGYYLNQAYSSKELTGLLD